LTGMVIAGTLNREGIRFRGLRWNSNEFSLLRNRLGLTPHVQVRIDPLDIDHAYIYDEEKRRWIKGDLITTGIEAGLTLHQYLVIRKRAKETQQSGEDRLAALARSRGELFDFMNEIFKETKKSKAGKKFARFYADGRKPSEHIAKTTFDAERSASPIGSYAIDDEPIAAPLPIDCSDMDDSDIEPINVRRRRI
jgi:putative transposase